MFEINQQQEQRQQLSQRMIQSAEILQMDTQELEQYIAAQAAENPMIDLEAMEKGRTASERSEKNEGREERERELLRKKLEWLNRCDEQNRVYYTEEAEEAEQREPWNVSREENSLKEYLISQMILRLKTDREREIMEFLTDSLDRRGYLTDSAETLAKTLGMEEQALLPYIRLLQSLEPAGVGAGSLSECLILQLRRLAESGMISEQDCGRLCRLADSQLEALSRQHFAQAAEALGVSREQVMADYQILKNLNPIPGNAFSSREEMRYVKPDAAVVKFEGYFEVIINDLYLPRVSVNAYYLKLLREDPSKEVQSYLNEKYKQLEWIKRCIGERSDTLLRVTREIVRQQAAFFEQPDGKRLPMSLRDVAEKLDLHESTVSRAVKNKFLQCARGVYPMNYFFVRKASNFDDGEGITPEQLRSAIRKLIEEENPAKPLSDQRIANRLELSGMPLSRRTVAKYRAEMLIPDASGRRQRSSAKQNETSK